MAKAITGPNWAEGTEIAIHCPGCDYYHTLNVYGPDRPRWGFNEDFDKPTFTPSLLVRTGSHAVPGYIDDPDCPPTTCHSFITDGKIQFLSDSTHALAGQTVDLPDIE